VHCVDILEPILVPLVVSPTLQVAAIFAALGPLLRELKLFSTLLIAKQVQTCVPDQ